MSISFEYVSEQLHRDFDVVREHLSDGADSFSKVRYFISGEDCSPNTLYLVTDTNAREFIDSPSYENCPAIFVGSPFFPPDGDSRSYITVRGYETFAVMNHLQETFARFCVWRDTLRSIQSDGLDLFHYINYAYQQLGNPLLLYDSGYKIIADTCDLHPVPNDTDWQRVISVGYWPPELRSTVRSETRPDVLPNVPYYYNSDRFEHSAALVNLCSGDDRVGTLFMMEYERSVTAEALLFMRTLSGFLSEELTRTQVATRGQTSLQRFFSTALTSDSISDEYLRHNLDQLGWEIDDSYFVVLFKEQPAIGDKTYLPQNLPELMGDCVCLSMNGNTVAVVHADRCRFAEVKEGLSVFIRDSMIKCGISLELSSFRDIAAGYEQACAAMEIGEATDPTFWYYSYTNYAVDHILSYAVGGVRFETICHPAIIALHREDLISGTSYLDTFSAYLSSEKNLTKLAAMMHIHRNTLIYRLDRIVQMTQIDFSNWKEMQHLSLSLQMLRTRGVVRDYGEPLKKS